MSGHSKWATIHRDKAVNDQKRGQVFTKIANAITLAVKESGGISDPASNFKLRLAVERGKAVNMPNDKIQKAIDRGLGRGEGGELYETLYEGYAPGGVGILVETLSSNRQRMVQEIKNIFDRAGGSIAQPGAVAFNFTSLGVIRVITGNLNRDDVMLSLMDLPVKDVVDDNNQDELLVYTEPDKLEMVKDQIAKLGYQFSDVEIVQIPQNVVEVNDPQKAKQLTDLLNQLDDLDDVQKVYSNAVFP